MTCDNCKKEIGRLESPRVLGDYGVCPTCYNRLTKSARSSQAQWLRLSVAAIGFIIAFVAPWLLSYHDTNAAIMWSWTWSFLGLFMLFVFPFVRLK